ncbi:MAG: right-handed parallel beta-helix repeat-containing protein [Streptosporangiaceae bacterium]
MSRSWLMTGIIILSGTALTVGLGVGPASAQATLVVGNGTSPAKCAVNATYNTISAAVAAASSGDTIQVCAGTYPETVRINMPDLTFDGNQAGVSPISGLPKAGTKSTVAGTGGGFILSQNADDTTISGFSIVDAGTTGSNDDAVEAFQGSSGLTLTDNVIRGNNNGVNLQNPDGTMPASIEDNVFAQNDQGGNYLNNPQTGTGVFISNGPADNTLIEGNAFSLDSQTAINFAGASGNPSTGLVVTGNKSTNDSTFVVATNSTNALIEDNTTTTSSKAPGGYGTGILDFGGNTGLRIDDNKLSVFGGSAGASGQSGIGVANYAGNSADTTVTGNRVTDWDYGVYVSSGYTSLDVSSNAVVHSGDSGIYLSSGTSGNVIVRNTISTSASDCQDASTGYLTAGTANTWLNNHGEDGNSSPAAICPA